jgi:hypothetical protein
MSTHRLHRASILRALGLAAALLAYSGIAGAGGFYGGNVLSPDRKPYGYSLDMMAQAMAVFDVTGNATSYPATPFQILYLQNLTSVDPKTCDYGTGYKFSGNSRFLVTEGVTYFVPLFTVNDLPAVLGTFPTSKSQAPAYFFGAHAYNATGTKIIVDGRATWVGPRYLGGPVSAEVPAAYLDEFGLTAPEFNLIQLGAFVSPLGIGTHSVRIKGELGNSEEFLNDLGFGCMEEDFTYTVIVLPELRE